MRIGLLALSLTLASAAAAAEAPLLLPRPAEMSVADGFMSVDGARVAVMDEGTREAGARFISLVERSGGPSLSFHSTGRIRFVRDGAVAAPEGYSIRVGPAGAEVRAATDSGLFYGATTLWQMLRDGRIPYAAIDDRPAFGWRGLMIDSARHFQPVEEIEALIERMAMAKLNVLHWHLTDDQGWRLPVEKHPELTRIGGCRRPAGAAGTAADGGPVAYCGGYTPQEIREVVAFAAMRHVTIVPEIDVPGHATAAIAAMPSLASTPHPPRAPSADWGVLPNLFNTEDATFGVLQDVLDATMALFPGAYIHLGGDEAVKDQWKADPRAQARMKALGLKDENALQGWFMARLGTYLARHGRRMIGWDEILEADVPADATIMSWRGVEGAVAAARAGHDAVLSPQPTLYLNHRQSASGDEPPGRGEIVSWERLHGFDPLPDALPPEARRHILGIQGNMWTEHARTRAYRDRMLWPRGLVIADIGWSHRSDSWRAFAPTLLAAMERDAQLGFVSNETPLAPLAEVVRNGAGVAVSLDAPAHIGVLRVERGGRPVTANSPAYAGPIGLSKPGAISARLFLDGKPIGPERRFDIDMRSPFRRTAAEMALCANKLPLRLEDDGATDGVRHILWGDIEKNCWIWRDAPVEQARTIVATVGSVPFNFSLGAEMADVRFARPRTPEGEMEVRRGDCDGPVVAMLPLKPAAGNAGLSTLSGAFSVPGAVRSDLCILFTQHGADPLWMLDRLEIQ